MRPRNLAVTCIDDREDNQAALRNYDHLFEIAAVTGMGDACEAIIAERNRDRPRDPVDFFLLDVDMSANSTDHQEYDFGGGKSGLKPYGPLLGLPYMSVRPTTQFVPYSEFWDRPEVTENGFVLLALSFLLSAIEGEQFTLSQTKEKLALWHDTAKLPHEAMGAGLRRFRETLLAQSKLGRVEPHNIETLIDDLNELAGSGETFSIPLRRRDDGKELALEWVYVSDETGEHVSLHSAFADVLNLLEQKQSILSSEVQKVVDELGPLSQYSVEGTLHSPRAIAAAAADVLTQCFKETRCVNVLQAFSGEHAFVKKEGGDLYLLKRSTMLVGWVFAWHRKVFEGVLDVRKTWDDLFLRRDDDGRGGAEHWHPAFLARRREVSSERHRRPFQAAEPSLDAEAFVKESYRLDHDAPAFLTDNDRKVCRIFAQDYLDKFITETYAPDLPSHGLWTGKEPTPYPRWMTASDTPPWHIERVED